LLFSHGAQLCRSGNTFRRKPIEEYFVSSENISRFMLLDGTHEELDGIMFGLMILLSRALFYVVNNYTVAIALITSSSKLKRPPAACCS
jgi:hypothetical protein